MKWSVVELSVVSLCSELKKAIVSHDSASCILICQQIIERLK